MPPRIGGITRRIIMRMWGNAIIGAVRELGGSWLETRKVKAETKREAIRERSKIATERQRASAEMSRAVNDRMLANATADNLMDREQMARMDRSHWDEFFTLLIMAPIIRAVIEAENVAEMIWALSNFPPLYMAFVTIVLSARLGVRGLTAALMGFKRGGGGPGKVVNLMSASGQGSGGSRAGRESHSPEAVSSESAPVSPAQGEGMPPASIYPEAKEGKTSAINYTPPLPDREPSR